MFGKSKREENEVRRWLDRAKAAPKSKQRRR
jgi:hypothetical protein